MRFSAERDKVLSPLRHRAYALLWFGQTVSLLGDRIYVTVLPFLVISLGGGASQIGTTLVFFSVPQLLFLLVGVVSVDRFPRRLTILTTDIIQVLSLGSAVAFLLSDALLLWHAYALSAVFGSCSAFSMPAAKSIIPDVVPRRQLVAANALTSLSNDIGTIIGPLLGATMVASGGLALALGADAVSFVISAVCLVAMATAVTRLGGEQRSEDVSPDAGTTADARLETGGSNSAAVSYLLELQEGFRAVAASQWLWATILIFSFVNVFYVSALEVALPLLAKQELGGPHVYGWVLSAVAVGSIVGAAVLGRFERLPRRGLISYAGVTAFGVMLSVMAVAHTGWQAALVGVLLGGSIVVFGLVWDTTLQELVPPEALGRVVSVDMLGSFGLLPLGYLSAGVLVAEVGPRPTILFAGIGTVILALGGLSLRSVRNLN